VFCREVTFVVAPLRRMIGRDGATNGDPCEPRPHNTGFVLVKSTLFCHFDVMAVLSSMSEKHIYRILTVAVIRVR
jgi:hypothetical protein